jgi:tripartite-type tricarboxylate transporter receptor subunit TctC
LALLSGELQMLVAPLVEVLPYVKSQKLTALAVTTKEPAPLLPNAPPIGSVLHGYDVSLWSGIFAPAGTPDTVISTVNAAVRKVLKSPEMAKRLAEQGYKSFDEAPGALGPLYVREIERWSRMVNISGAKID